ncbi:XdhC/CoxI family protein [Niallia sp. XMNu-256]|uniref:XdhC family protein n=1 Tax=Niallia sp. XMNu-256 TaxID=3082444 RepID=UPI0030CC0670
MSENALVMEAIKKAQESSIKAALATVVSVKGSAYRREGAMMLIDGAEKTTGMISGGCLESDVAETAKEVIVSGQPILKTYDLDEDLVWGLGLGCPGIVDIYIEPVPTRDEMTECRSFNRWLDCVKNQEEGVLVTILQTEGYADGGRMFIPKEGSPIGSLGDRFLNEKAATIGLAKLNESNPKSESILMTRSDGVELLVFLDVYIPPVTLLIFGAGHDALPVAKLGVSLGMRTVVVDQRPAFNNEERFPGMKRLVINPAKFNEQIKITNRTYIVIMNHHIDRDIETLKFVLPSNAAYIGLLGPRSRGNKLIHAIETEGIRVSDNKLAKLHSPIGLDIGSVTPEEIAISILAEIIAVRTGHHGGFLQGSQRIHGIVN